MLAADPQIKEFAHLLSLHALSTRAQAGGNMLDQAVLSEGLYRDLASILLQRSFKSTNLFVANGDTIDLHDQAAPAICAQVTIREDRDKITQTLESFFSRGHDKAYESIYFFIIGEKPAYDPKKPFITNSGFNFNHKEHIIDLPGMVRLAQALPLEELQKLVATARKHIHVKSQPKFNRALLVAVSALVVTITAAVALIFWWGVDEKVIIPGQNSLEKQINRAKLEGASTTISSSEFVTAVPFVVPHLVPGADATEVTGNHVALSNSSPLRPKNQDLVFNAGRCRFLGFATWPTESVLLGNASITTISCVMHNGDAYGLGESGGPVIGFVAKLDSPADRDLPLVRNQGAATLSKDDKYIVRFNQPIQEMVFKGKTETPW